VVIFTIFTSPNPTTPIFTQSRQAATNRTNRAYPASGIEHRESSNEQFFSKKSSKYIEQFGIVWYIVNRNIELRI
jgi:uncharacterized glyoxalase superfamily protein PhnB